MDEVSYGIVLLGKRLPHLIHLSASRIRCSATLFLCCLSPCRVASHPQGAGSVCLDVINQTWSPMFDLVNVFETFLPQLLLYPNPSDPLNGEAAALHMRDPAAYQKKVGGGW